MKCPDMRIHVSTMPSMAWHLNKIFHKHFNIFASVSIDTKLYTCEVCTYGIKYLYVLFPIVHIGCALVIY